jgi:ribosomal protein L20A (L18A)
MSAWYQGKIRYQKIDEKDKTIKITEVYLVDAVSYTDAEARIYSTVASNTPDFHLFGLSRMKLQEVFFVEDGAETWFKVKVNFMSFDEKSQKEKRTPFMMLINAENPLEAYNLISERLGTVEDYQITDINITNILEVIPYEEVDEKLKHGNFKPLAEVSVN